MTKTEIEFLRNAGFTLAEIMAMAAPVQNDENQAAAAADQPAVSQQNAQIPSPEPAPAPVQPAAAPVPPAADNNPAMTEILNKILNAIQAGNRSSAQIAAPEIKSPEEIAGQLY